MHSTPFPHWRFDHSRVSVRFAGRIRGDAEKLGRREVLKRLDGMPSDLAWLEQRHSATARPAAAGACGEGDGFWTQQQKLALSIVTADCVPIICGSDRVILAIHAGWRGIVAGIIDVTLAESPVASPELEAWLGPAIGSCCYEVGDDVAAQVIAASNETVASTGRSGRQHIDLHRAASFQLRRLGISRIHQVEACTKCNPDSLWSYRGSLGTNGRNLTFAWLTG